MTSDLKYTIQEKITAMNQELSEPTDGLPAVSLSVGVAFSDRENPGESIFKDADKALYQIKEHGKHGCGFYGEKRNRRISIRISGEAWKGSVFSSGYFYFEEN